MKYLIIFNLFALSKRGKISNLPLPKSKGLCIISLLTPGFAEN
jgi:hypothetical protein